MNKWSRELCPHRHPRPFTLLDCFGTHLDRIHLEVGLLLAICRAFLEELLSTLVDHRDISVIEIAAFPAWTFFNGALAVELLCLLLLLILVQ